MSLCQLPDGVFQPKEGGLGGQLTNYVQEAVKKSELTGCVGGEDFSLGTLTSEWGW